MTTVSAPVQPGSEQLHLGKSVEGPRHAVARAFVIVTPDRRTVQHCRAGLIKLARQDCAESDG
jgi:hypothetical protein